MAWIWTAFKLLFRLSWLALIVLMIFLNLRLYWPSPLALDNESIPPTLLAQLRANRDVWESDAPKKMQKLFPEGHYFCYALHGLTWIEAALRDPAHQEKAIQEAKWAVKFLESDEGESAFPSSLPPTNGMFYSAWLCHLQAGIVSLQSGSDSKQSEKLRVHCDKISKLLQTSETPFPPSYRNQAWPCDTLPAIHAMTTYDRIHGTSRYRETVSNWLSTAKQCLDPATGLLPHTSNPVDGQPIQGARATSQVVILRFLADIDPAFARDQYSKFRDQYYQPLAWLPSVREYPAGESGTGDVDSGPLIFGRSLSATVFTIGTAQIYGDKSQADAIAQCGETIGLPWTMDNKKRYLNGILPIGDIMVAYNHVACRWTPSKNDESAVHQPSRQYSISSWWRVPTHLVSSLMLFPLLIRFIRKRRLSSKQRTPEPTK